MNIVHGNSERFVETIYLHPLASKNTHMKKATLPCLCLIAILILSCNDAKEDKTTTEVSTDTTETATETNKNAPVIATLNVTMTGGELAGTYTASCKEGCCSWGIAGNNVFGNQYSEAGKGPKELS